MRRSILAGALLLAGLSALAIADNARPWRRLQVEFLERERRALASEVATGRAAGSLAVARWITASSAPGSQSRSFSHSVRR